MLKYHKLEVKVSETHALDIEVPVWVTPILEAIHAARGAVKVTGEVLADRAPPDAEDEFTRLVNLYKFTEREDGSRGIPYVAAVYGNFGPGTAALAQAIAEATVDAPPVAPVDLLAGVQTSSVGG